MGEGMLKRGEDAKSPESTGSEWDALSSMSESESFDDWNNIDWGDLSEQEEQSEEESSDAAAEDDSADAEETSADETEETSEAPAPMNITISMERSDGNSIYLFAEDMELNSSEKYL